MIHQLPAVPCGMMLEGHRDPDLLAVVVAAAAASSSSSLPSSLSSSSSSAESAFRLQTDWGVP